MSLNGHGEPEDLTIGCWIQEEDNGFIQLVCRGPLSFVIEGLINYQGGVVRQLLNKQKEQQADITEAIVTNTEFFEIIKDLGGPETNDDSSAEER